MIGESAAPPARRVWRWVKRGLIVFVVVVIPVALAIPAYWGYRPRALINGALIDGSELKTRVAEFYEKNRRLPQPAEAAEPQLRPRTAQSVVWDAAGRRVIITVAEPERLSGKRIEIGAEERNGTLFWTCRGIDLESKYLPATCR